MTDSTAFEWQRRQLLLAAGGIALVASPLVNAVALAPGRASVPPRPIAPVRASADRIIAIDAALRPFRSNGPRIEAERLGRKVVVHNYGHGGSGWSLSWGAAAQALRLVQETGSRELAVIGCGAIGLTSALLAQRAGLQVCIYARERPPLVASSFATGVWSPNSRLCAATQASPDFAMRWESMARHAYRAHQDLLGLPGQPVQWRDSYTLTNNASGLPTPIISDEPAYAQLDARLADLHPGSLLLPDDANPFPVRHARLGSELIFNIGAYARMLLEEYLLLGGELQPRSFSDSAELAELPQQTLINATGYGARTLFADSSVVPIRGQVARLIPQPEVDYGLNYDNAVFMLPRQDGLIIQSPSLGNFGNSDTRPDRASVLKAIDCVAGLFDSRNSTS